MRLAYNSLSSRCFLALESDHRKLHMLLLLFRHLNWIARLISGVNGLTVGFNSISAECVFSSHAFYDSDIW